MYYDYFKLLDNFFVLVLNITYWYKKQRERKYIKLYINIIKCIKHYTVNTIPLNLR